MENSGGFFDKLHDGYIAVSQAVTPNPPNRRSEMIRTLQTEYTAERKQCEEVLEKVLGDRKRVCSIVELICGDHVLPEEREVAPSSSSSISRALAGVGIQDIELHSVCQHHGFGQRSLI